MSFYRRIEPLAKMQDQGKLIVEKLNKENLIDEVNSNN